MRLICDESFLLCRSLILCKSDPALLDLAPDSLRSLCYEPRHPQQVDVAVFCAFTSLSRFEIINVASSDAVDWTPLHRLGLEELVMVNSPALVHALRVPTAFRSLRHLHIEDTITPHDHPLHESSDDASDSAHSIAYEADLGKVFTFVPTCLDRFPLEQISCMRDIFNSVDKSSLGLWQEIGNDNPEMITFRKQKGPELAI